LCVEVHNYRRILTTIQTNRPGTDSLVLPMSLEENSGTAVDTVRYQCQQILDALARTPLAKRSGFWGC
jgi:hypothetical protein